MSEATRFKKGVSGNPSGRPKTRIDLLKVKALCAEDLKRLIAKYFDYDRMQVAAAIKDKSTKALDLIILTTIEAAINKGDIARAESLFLRSVGRAHKVAEEGEAKPFMVIERLNGERTILGVEE